MPKPHAFSTEESAALGARLSGVEVVTSHPMPFSSAIISELRKNEGMKFIECSSVSAAANAAIGASLGGKRVFVPTSIPKSIEDIFTMSYMRLPIVFANISRPLGPYTIRHDHSDVAALLDAGSLIFMPESNQELTETVVQAYKVSEQALLPSVVNIDTANFREHVTPVQDSFSRRFLGKYKPLTPIDKKPRYFASPDDSYEEMKKQQHKAVKIVADHIENSSKLWAKKTKRVLPLVETYKTEDADFILVMAGYHSPTAKAAVDRLRSQGKKAGLLRLRVLRPWPSVQIDNALKNAKKVAVFDQAVSPGRFGVLYREINDKSRCSNFISLGKHPGEKDFIGMLDRLEKSGKDEVVWV